MSVALVSGGYKGLGLAWCRQLAKAGYTVILTARSQEKANLGASTLLSEGLKVIHKALNVVDEDDLKNLAVWVKNEFEQLDVLINNAGVNPKDFENEERASEAFYLDSLKAETVLETIEVNSIAPLLLIKHFRSLLKASKGKVISVSSWLGSVSEVQIAGHYGYCGSKNLLNMLNKLASNELRQDEITAITINPGWVQTDMGGRKATFTPDQSVQSMIANVLMKISLKDSGKFLNYDGTNHPW